MVITAMLGDLLGTLGQMLLVSLNLADIVVGQSGCL
jgi:hypothetical protein